MSVFCEPVDVNEAAFKLFRKTLKAPMILLPKYFVPPILLLLIICAFDQDACAQRLVPDLEKKTIVLDPGHGGNDKGAMGPEGTYEKDITLTLAWMVANRLRNKYHVKLTRSDDYGTDIFSRTAVANHEGADVFLSFHVGGDFIYKTEGIGIFTYQEAFEQTTGFQTESPVMGNANNEKTPWDQIQVKHNALSKRLAEAMYDQLCHIQDVGTCRIQNAPLMVLMGADMPALLIEVGYVTNPAEEKKLNDTAWLSDVASKISTGIEHFLSEMP